MPMIPTLTKRSKECEEWLIGLVRANGIYVDTAKPVPEIAIPLLVAFVKQQRADALECAANEVLDAFCRSKGAGPKLKYITDTIVEFLREQKAREEHDAS